LRLNIFNKQKGGKIPACSLLVIKAVFRSQTIVTEKSRLLSASAPMMLASFCMFHSFMCRTAIVNWPGRPVEGIRYFLFWRSNSLRRNKLN